MRLLVLKERLLVFKMRLLVLKERLLVFKMRLLLLKERLLVFKMRLLVLKKRLLVLKKRLLHLKMAHPLEKKGLFVFNVSLLPGSEHRPRDKRPLPVEAKRALLGYPAPPPSSLVRRSLARLRRSGGARRSVPPRIPCEAGRRAEAEHGARESGGSGRNSEPSVRPAAGEAAADASAD
jgi:hypothetical protein